MSLTTYFDHSRRRGFATYLGTVGYGLLEEFMSDVVRQGAEAYPKLINGLNAELRLAPKEIGQFLAFAQMLGAQAKFGPVAVVVGEQQSYEEVHTLGLLTVQICALQPFWTVEDAEAWLVEVQSSDPELVMPS
jgi:hypothetical protein